VLRIARSPFWFFLLFTIAMTWPLAARSTHSLASDYGDPLFTTWAMGWVSAHLSALVHGRVDALGAFWDANIFYPEPNALAFSDHMFTEAVQVLPIYWSTGNLLLCYNSALILSFALCGYGTCLLVRDMTGSTAAALAAGVFAAFNEYRLSYEISHLQSLSIHWLPFALLGLHRFIARGSRIALAGGAASLVLLNLSAGFHMLYCAPFVASFVLLDLAWHGRLRDARAWAELAASVAFAAAATFPFAWRYIVMQRQLHFDRQLDEVIRFSATLDHYRAALPGFAIPLALAVVAVVLNVRPLRPSTMAADRTSRLAPRVVAAFAVGALLTFWLSLGPVVQGGGHPLPIPGLYVLLYNFAPGFKGIRAVARYAMLFFLILGMLAGFGIAAIEARWRKAAPIVAAIGCAAFLWPLRPAPFPLDREWPFVSAGLAPPPAYLRPAPSPPPVYRFLATLDQKAVVAEFPFGDNAYDLRYMYFSAFHAHRMLGGFSGVFPDRWVARRDELAQPLAHPDLAWNALDGATLAVVHARGWSDATGARIVEWLRAHGAREAGVFDEAHVLELRR